MYYLLRYHNSMQQDKIITIDGPSGVGKTTIAALVADRLHLPVVPSGRLFRAIAWVLARQGVVLEDRQSVEAYVSNVVFTMTSSGEIQFEGKNITSLLDGADLGVEASKIAPYPIVRRYVLEMQRRLGEEHGCVIEGRITGVVVFPNALLKIWLTADLTTRIERVTRKYGERAAEMIRARDETDTTRTNAPMEKAKDAIEIDATHMNAEEVVTRIIDLYTAKK
jgi:cytidylate kinase